MSSEPVVYEASPLPDMARKPQAVLAEAKVAAEALVGVVRQGKLARKFGGEREHLFYEAWQTVGKFYGITAKVISSGYVEFGTAQGFEAKAVAVNRDGMEISSAESLCLSDEPNWRNKPLFQLKSMAQTRACSKALRNVLAWVVVLAGYAATPAEEMTGNEYHPAAQSAPASSSARPQQPKSTGEDVKAKLKTELEEYCTLEDGVVNMDLYTATLKEVSQFGNPPKWIDDVDRASEAWCGKALGVLRKKAAEKSAEAAA